MITHYALFFSLVIFNFTYAVHAQECTKTNLAESCSSIIGDLAKDQCLIVGETYIKDRGAWYWTKKHNIFPKADFIDLFTVIDGSNRNTKYGTIFLGVERISNRKSSNEVDLKRNKNSNFEISELKKRYSRSVQRKSIPTDAVTAWLKIRGYGNLYQNLPNSTLKQFDFDLGEAKDRHLRAQLIRHKSSAVSCIGFDIGYERHFKEIHGVVIDLDNPNFPENDFEIVLE